MLVLEYLRSIPLHRWLFSLVIALAISAVPHAVMVYTQHQPTAYLNLQGFAAVGLGIFAELRRQWAERQRDEAARQVTRSDLKEIVLAAEHARR
jgi:hypothetical protein